VSSDLQAFYEDLYAHEDPERARFYGGWRALGARSKAAHVSALLARAGAAPERVVEIGCGDGALLAALDVGAVFDGFEIAEEVAALARSRGLARVRRIEAYDGVTIPADDDAYDLAILSHVVEHIPDPAPVLAEAARVAPVVLVEVPLEANRSARRPSVRAEAARIGHVHAFDRAAVRALLDAAGLRVVEELTDPLSLAHHSYFATSLQGRAKAAAKTFVRRTAFRASAGRAERLFTVHYACLAARAG
jgi:SAM-dependent methyltransferase